MLAFTREIDESLRRCELTYVAREAIDLGLAREQHRQYEVALAECGCEVQRLPAATGMADAVFIEDTCIALSELTIIARPGSPSRRGEVIAVAEALRTIRELKFLRAPATLDGGDVLVAGREIFVGLSRRTNDAAIEQLSEWLVPLGYKIVPVTVMGCLHLKTAITQISPDKMLVNRDWLDSGIFRDWSLLEIDPAEPFAANSLLLGNQLIYPTAYPRTRDKLMAKGVEIVPVNISELAKAEAGVSCCSVILPDGTG